MISMLIKFDYFNDINADWKAFWKLPILRGILLSRRKCRKGDYTQVKSFHKSQNFGVSERRLKRW